MISRYMVDVTSQRMQETEQAILEQRKYVESLTDPALKTIAARTLATLEDILLIMHRTHGLLVETATDAPEEMEQVERRSPGTKRPGETSDASPRS